ncbi:MAG TPA: hypothetical protein VJU83_09630 [Burkholderiales bacterium]|nr:hypothetical protein [Burkholderiales bacterium]
MSAAALVARLDRVTQVTPTRWRAVCPAHESKRNTQSLAITETSDGTVLIKCFAGCGAVDIVGAVGVDIRELFAPDSRPTDSPRNGDKPNHWHAIREAVSTLKRDCLIVAIASEDMRAGKALSAADVEILNAAAARVRAAIEACQ